MRVVRGARTSPRAFLNSRCGSHNHQKETVLEPQRERLDFPHKERSSDCRDQDAAVDGRGVKLFEGHDDGLARQPAQVSTQSPPKFGKHHLETSEERAAHSFESPTEIATWRPETAHGLTPSVLLNSTMRNLLNNKLKLKLAKRARARA